MTAKMIINRIKTIRFISMVVLLSNIANCKADEIDDPFNFQCFPKNSNLLPQFLPEGQDAIVIQVTDHVINQIVSRIYSIYLKEILGYQKVIIREISFPSNMSEQVKLFNTLEDIVTSLSPTKMPRTVLNLGVWMPPDYHTTPHDLDMAGPLGPIGRYGWFFSKNLIRDGDLPSLYPYTIFSEPNTDYIRQFILDTRSLSFLKRMIEPLCPICKKGMFIPKQCQHNVQCATLLAPTFKETGFVIQHIDELKLYVNVIFLGNNLQLAISYLQRQYERELAVNTLGKAKKFLFLYRTPSEIVDTFSQYEMISMPRCELMESCEDTLCNYELIPMLKYSTEQIKTAIAAQSSFWAINFQNADIQFMLDLYNNATTMQPLMAELANNGISKTTESEELLQEMIRRNYRNFNSESLSTRQMYNDIACRWMHENEQLYLRWGSVGKKQDVYIGGIFPITAVRSIYSGIIPAANMAIDAINANDTILPNVNLILLTFDGKCRPDIVMNSFVQIYQRSARVLGILGPACSETVEPIAGVSKHFKMPIISYSAEGASFLDRETYPYFFRTIGENRQYEPVYLKLLQQMNWNRVAALTEDGQKYTEYISHMETALKENNIELISNKKFPRNVMPEEMSRNLNELKRKNAHIIIADIYDEIAQIVMCEAYKLKMTAADGYVWFLPIWLSKKWVNSTKTGVNITCTESQIMEMIEGHFSLSHAPFEDNDTLMQENITVGEWRNRYENLLSKQARNEESSVYAGFTYDAVWVYALALQQLIKEDASQLSNLHSEKTTSRLVQILEATDFAGLSGKIQFGEGASRFSVINVLQWINGRSNLIGSFYPNISEAKDIRYRKLLGGHLVLNKTNIVWLSDKIPNDGTITCSVDGLAKFLNTDCTNAVYILTTCVCLLFVVMLSIASFMFWKRQYDRKLKRSAKVMRNFGIDLLSPSSMPSNTLDKWEIPKDRVVINRRLGEGAFGTVYGGEALLDDIWTAVAVKTLKVGSGTEDRLDFLSEAEAMKRFDHKNIVKLLGVCLQTEPIYTIMEFMLYGDLKTYLLARRHLVTDKISDDSDISPKRLTIMALDIARGLSYLADNKYVHRDIACRNCLVNSNRVIKLGDFGMARPMFENDYYKFNRKGMLPVRWMSPESLGLGIFTPGSDVWSFGVLMYEIITFGSFPFQGLTNNQVLEHIKNGHILTIPTGVKPQLEGLMRACWNPQYKKRPTASEIADFISNYPRLVTPCLDVPLASVQMPETDSDQMELLPGLRKRLNVGKADLTASSTLNNLDDKNGSTLPNGIMLSELNVPPDLTNGGMCSSASISNNINNNGYICNGFNDGYMPVSNAYNPVEPLLHKHRNEDISRSSLSLKRYVPMCGFKRNNPLFIDSSTSVL